MRETNHQSDTIHRQNALREWHTNPGKYPKSFLMHWKNGDFNHLKAPPHA
jgi:hypothetical protein